MQQLHFAAVASVGCHIYRCHQGVCLGHSQALDMPDLLMHDFCLIAAHAFHLTTRRLQLNQESQISQVTATCDHGGPQTSTAQKQTAWTHPANILALILYDQFSERHESVAP